MLTLLCAKARLKKLLKSHHDKILCNTSGIIRGSRPASSRKKSFERALIDNLFAGRGVSTKLRPKVVAGLVERYGGKARNWQHVKGLGTIVRGDRYVTAEVHWFQEPSVGRCEFKVKRWL